MTSLVNYFIENEHAIANCNPLIETFHFIQAIHNSATRNYKYSKLRYLRIVAICFSN